MPPSKKSRLMLTLAALIVMACCALAQTTAAKKSGRLKGMVTDNLRQPIASTRVLIKGTGKVFVVRADDKTGEYQVKLPEGIYQVSIEERPGFAAYKQDGVKVKSGESTVLDITPESRIYYEDCDKGLIRP
jgi:Carboxypeptidase regulatory-like domain